MVGTFKGMLAIHLAARVAKAITGNFLGLEVDELIEDVQDAIGEVANMLGGSVKGMLAENGRDIELSLPSTVCGKDYCLKHKEDVELVLVPFTTADGEFLVELQIQETAKDAGSGFLLDMDRKKIIDKVLEAARAKITPVVGGLLGTQLKTASAANRLVSKAEVFEIVNKSVFATLEVEGELQGAVYLVVSIKDAILYGGTLIMLPEAELEGRMKDEDFGADEADAFGEIANIISGIYSATFEEMYPQKIRFVKKDLKVVVPTKVDTDSPDPIPNQMYFMASALVELDSKPVDEIRLLFPAELFGIEIDRKGAAQPDAPSAAQKPASDVRQPASNVGSVPSDAGQSVMKETGPELDPDWTSPAGTGSVEEVVAAPAGPDVEMGGPGSQVLVIAEDPSSGQVFSETIRECGYSVQLLGFNDKIKDAAAAGGVSAVFLIMEKVNEKGMAAIIKAKSVCGNSSPLIAAGPQWTRRTVLQAVKYGARDIVVTPTVPAEVRQKVETHLEASNPGCLVPTDQRSQTEYSSF